MVVNKIGLIFIIGLLFLSSCKKKAAEEPAVDTTTPAPVIVAPSKPTVVNPISLNALTNSNLTLTGGCETDATVTLAGDDAQTTICVSSSYSFTVSKTISGNYFLNLSQANSAGPSGIVTVSWTLDNDVPADIILTSPLSNPFTSGDNTLHIVGNCEVGAVVNISGDFAGSTNCSGGTFAFNTITESTDGSYIYSLSQSDVATNASTPMTFTWVRDSTIPPTPEITSFSDNPHYTNYSPLVVMGNCVAGNAVHISEAGIDIASGACSVSGTFTLNIAKGADNTYGLTVYQIDATSLIESAGYDFSWIYDTQIPATPVITSPSQSPATTSSLLVISGECEQNATVNLTGDSNASAVCVSQTFSFTVSAPIDGTYSYSIDQTDLAQNTSAAANQDWIRDSFALAMPTIITPTAQPFISNAAALTLSGECETGLTVVLTGVASSDVTTPANSLSLICEDSSFSYTIASVDGTYNLTLYQTNGVINSSTTAKTWVKDTVEPTTTMDSSPSATNYSLVSTFTFSSNENPITFQCSLDGAAYSTCVSPLNFTNLANGVRTLNVRARDQAGNVDSTPSTYTWTQEAYKAIALYHFNSTGPLVDSGSYSGGAKNDLTDNSSASVAGKFSEARLMNTTSNYTTVANTPSQGAIRKYLTLESFIKLNSLPGSYAPIISKINTAGPAESFEYGIRKQGSKYYIYFRGSTNGTTYTEVRSAALSAGEQAALTAGFAHIAVTWNLGSIKYYFNGVSKGTSSIGTVGSSDLAASTAPLRVGYNGSTSINGAIDEARVSQIVRWSTNFTPPTSEYSAD